MAMTGRGSSMVMSQIAALRAMQGHRVEAGWFDTDRYPAEEGETVGVSVARVARLNNFGGTINHPGGTPYIPNAIVGGAAVGSRFVDIHGGFKGPYLVTKPHTIYIPARPFMTKAYNDFKNNAAKMQAVIINKVITGQITALQALNQIGMELENQIALSIKKGQWQPNAPSTVAKKGFDRPLIESSLMWKSVNSKVI